MKTKLTTEERKVLAELLPIIMHDERSTRGWNKRMKELVENGTKLDAIQQGVLKHTGNRIKEYEYLRKMYGYDEA